MSSGAATVYSLIKNHPFADGNKRTGAFVLLMMLARGAGGALPCRMLSWKG